MSTKDGFDATAHITARHPETKVVVIALFDDQYMALAVRYWEGMVDVRDPSTGTVLGRGYLEMTGY